MSAPLTMSIREARSIALFVNPDCWVPWMMRGSMLFGLVAVFATGNAYVAFLFFLFGGILGAAYGVPLMAYRYLRYLERTFGEGAAVRFLRYWRKPDLAAICREFGNPEDHTK